MHSLKEVSSRQEFKRQPEVGGANNHKEIKGIAKQRHPGGTSSANKEELEAERPIKILQFRDGGQNLDGESPA